MHRMDTPTPIFGYRKYWAHKFGPAPWLPMSREEMDELGWDSCDIIIVTGDAYVDHPSFGMAVIGRVLEAQGFRVGIIAQPDWQDSSDFCRLGRPNLFFGVTAGNMDSLVNHYTSERRLRSDDAYTPNAQAGKRPDRATLVYSQRCREAWPDVPIVLGGIEASLRRIAHYDYWSDKVRRSVLVDAKADILLYGNAERAVVELAHRLAGGASLKDLEDLRGVALIHQKLGPDWVEIDARNPEVLETPRKAEVPLSDLTTAKPKARQRQREALRMPGFIEVRDNPLLYAHASRLLHLESNPGNARVLLQDQGNGRQIRINPPPIPLTTPELDQVFELPYQRQPHPSYGRARIPAYEMIRFSINIMRGCFGGCSFCSITEHEGRIIQNRSEDSILREIQSFQDHPDFTGQVSDLGGPTANMWRLRCKDPKIEASCRRLSCVYPSICPNMGTDQRPLIQLYRKARALPGVKKIAIASGLRYDLALQTPEYIKELVTHHVGGYLKIAPEHTESGPLSKMMKPSIGLYDRFKALFDKYSSEAGKEQYLIPYFIAAHPGTSDEDMLALALWLKAKGFRPNQVQAFLPTPMALASAMYHSERNPLKKLGQDSEQVQIPKGARQRRLHKAFLRYHDPENWPLLRETLKRMGRADLIGNGKKHLIPSWQPTGTGQRPEGSRCTTGPAKTQTSNQSKPKHHRTRRPK